jgi:hypothetical protein
MSKQIIGFIGFIGSGKDTAADYLVDNYNFQRLSFAGTLKDAVAAVFGWDRELLEGKTPEAREWRECADEWWAKRLNTPGLTPRWVLQQWGTEVCRMHFHDDIWIASLENSLRRSEKDVVISDVRFPNEIAAIRAQGGIVGRVKRGEDPAWYNLAQTANSSNVLEHQQARRTFNELGIHPSESAWIGQPMDFVIPNNAALSDLYARVVDLLKI